MQAVTYRDYGDPSVLKMEERPDPEPGGDEVLIRVAAAGVNPIDARLRAGEMRMMMPGGFPRIPGYDVAGTVQDAGRHTHFKQGDRVLAFLDHVYGGGYAELATCSASAAAPIADEMPIEQAAAIPLAASTALQSLRDFGKLKQGDRVLVNGASGGVGAFAVQIANALGAQVTGVASGEHEEFVRGLGAADFIDYTRTDYSKSGRQWDIVFDAAGKSSYNAARGAMSAEGRYVSTEPDLKGFATSLLTWPLSQKASVMLARSRKDDLNQLVGLYNTGKLKVEVAKQLPLSDAAEAHRMQMEDSFCGKIVLMVV